MKKNLLFSIVSLTALMFLIVGCNTQTEEVSSEETSNQESEEAEEAIYPRTVTHTNGEITLEQQPEKIVAINEHIIDVLVMLGHPPIASEAIEEVSNSTIMDPYLEGQDIIDLGNRLNLETLLDMESDLAILTTDKINELEQIEPLAPTAVIEWGTDYPSSIRKIAELIGEEAKAEEIITDYETKVAETKKVIGSEFDETVLVLRANGKNFTAISTEDFSLLYEELGFSPVADIEYGGELTIEGVSAANADHIIIAEWARNSDPENPNSLINMWHDNSVWQSLEPVKNDNVYVMDKLFIEPVFSSQFEILELAEEIATK
ncbi:MULTISPECIES: ABC transporter substrate-binding protein [Paraliobacillus]|uniref:ABC transporter substrate-binding protein n=1 Tax=Paraliobacillus TaxID=200903 RepID=UPI000DD2F0CE|nr:MULTISPECIES: ABC transporter substrate-binding protein [Paraliobacillus]